ncbi:hypothetical protein [Streptomyces sp. 061-3]|uniref:hypothetical protein n=1 Tax=Streptomyces sp. 061-3 TaxID=2789268 RepID=UPI00397EC7E6
MAVTLGIVPLHATVRVPPADGFWNFDGRLVITEDRHAELWLDDADALAANARWGAEQGARLEAPDTA